jgi:hypothetical protein
MPSDNPKVSAYIPQHLFDRFKSFFKERDISMSQAVGVIFAEYFQLDLQVNFISGSLKEGVILAKLEILEKEVQDLKFSASELPINLLNDLRNLEYLVNQINNRLSEVEARQISELNSTLLCEPLKISQEDNSVKQLSILENAENQSECDHNQVVTEEVRQVNNSDSSKPLEVLPSKPLEVLPSKPLEVFPSEPLEVFPSEPLEVFPSEPLEVFPSEPLEVLPSEPQPNVVFNVDYLAKRLGISAGYIVVYKSKHKDDKQKFLDWIQSKDPNRIRWVEAASKKRGVLYKPVDDTDSKLLSKLQKWIKKNLES